MLTPVLIAKVAPPVEIAMQRLEIEELNMKVDTKLN